MLLPATKVLLETFSQTKVIDGVIFRLEQFARRVR